MRLFTAVDIPAPIRGRLASLVDQFRPLAELSWSTPDMYHITTKFIGEWPENRLGELIQVLGGVRAAGPIPISLTELGWIGGRRVLCVHVASPKLGPLAEATESALTAIGVPVEDRIFNPHLTLARNRKKAKLSKLEPAMARLAPPSLGDFQASSFGLYQSRGGKYTLLKEFSFF
jgi:2'-5' RNA ligase